MRGTKNRELKNAKSTTPCNKINNDSSLKSFEERRRKEDNERRSISLFEFLDDSGLRHFVMLSSSDLEHVQVRMPWHFPKSRRFHLVRRWNIPVGLNYRCLLHQSQSSNIGVATKHSTMSSHILVTGVPIPCTWITDHTSVLSVMMMMTTVRVMMMMMTLQYSGRLYKVFQVLRVHNRCRDAE